jgi:hypothetical protein
LIFISIRPLKNESRRYRLFFRFQN